MNSWVILAMKFCHFLDCKMVQNKQIFKIGLKMPKVTIFKCQKMALRTPKSKNGLQKPRETPPKMVD